MPPSLRRTFSSPSVRSSPYPGLSSGLLGSPSGTAGTRHQGHGHRRSLGSETGSRRVLADIEWWRVADGQHGGDAGVESEERSPDDDQGSGLSQAVEDVLSGAGFSFTDASVDCPLTPLLRIPRMLEVRFPPRY